MNSPIFILSTIIGYHKFSYAKKLIWKLPYIAFRELGRLFKSEEQEEWFFKSGKDKEWGSIGISFSLFSNFCDKTCYVENLLEML